MKSWVSLGWSVVAVILFMACNYMKQSNSFSNYNHQIDSLPAIVIQPKVEQEQSALTIDNTSKILIHNSELLLAKSIFLKSEREDFNSEQDNFFNKRGLPHIIFKDLKIDVDGNENITYLNQDF